MSEEDLEPDDEIWDKVYADFNAANQVKFAYRWGWELLLASQAGDIERVKHILSLPLETGGMLLIRLTMKDEQGNTALHLAAQAGHLEVVKTLIAHGLSLDQTNIHHETPAALANKAGFQSVVEFHREKQGYRKAIALTTALDFQRRASYNYDVLYDVKYGGKAKMATRYPLNLPAELKQTAARLAKQQGVSLNQFFLWSISEKVTELKSSIDDPNFPWITYRRGASGIPTPVIRGTGLRVETLVVAHQRWGQSTAELAEAYDLSLEAVETALAYYQAHQAEIDALIRIEQEIEARHVKA